MSFFSRDVASPPRPAASSAARFPRFTVFGLLSAALAACGEEPRPPIVEEPPPPAPVVMPLGVGDVWVYDEYEDARLGMTWVQELVTMQGRAALRVVAKDESSGVATVRFSSEGNCTNDTYFLRETSSGALEGSDDGQNWFLLVDPTQVAWSNVVHAFEHRSAPRFAAAPTVSFATTTVSVIAGEFTDALTDASVPSASNAWSQSVGLLSHSKSYSLRGESSLRRLELTSFAITTADGTRRRVGVVPDGTAVPRSPSRLLVRRSGDGTAAVTWADCSLDESSFVLERRCGSEVDFQPIASAGSDLPSAVDATVPEASCTYRVTATNPSGSSQPTTFAMGDASTPLTPETPVVRRVDDGGTLAISLVAKATSDFGVTSATVSWFDGTSWHDLADPVPFDGSTSSFRTYLYANPDGSVTRVRQSASGMQQASIDWAPGTYRFRVVAHGTSADSLASPEAELVVE